MNASEAGQRYMPGHRLADPPRSRKPHFLRGRLQRARGRNGEARQQGATGRKSRELAFSS